MITSLKRWGGSRLQTLAAGTVLAAVMAFVVGSMPQPVAAQTAAALETATFAGGCFWCVEADFQKVEGVSDVVSGFIGGKTPNPTYRQVVSGGTGHTEAIQFKFDPKKVSYERLVSIFWRTIDPLDAGGQFCDRGDSYRTGIFTHSAEQKRIADASKAALDASGRFKQKIATNVEDAGPFTAAEAYHQNFHVKDPGRYYSYRAGCGRDARIKALWGAEAGGKTVTQ
jgi:peptide-methionine (S)-S-oxide reductase